MVVQIQSDLEVDIRCTHALQKKVNLHSIKMNDAARWWWSVNLFVTWLREGVVLWWHWCSYGDVKLNCFFAVQTTKEKDKKEDKFSSCVCQKRRRMRPNNKHSVYHTLCKNKMTGPSFFPSPVISSVDKWQVNCRGMLICFTHERKNEWKQYWKVRAGSVLFDRSPRQSVSGEFGRLSSHQSQDWEEHRLRRLRLGKIGICVLC